MLQVLDSQWKEHLAAMDHLRQGIHLRGYAQKNPKQEYKREAFELFTEMLDRIKHEVVTTLCKVRVQREEDVQAVEEQRRSHGEMEFQHAQMSAMGGGAAAPEGRPQDMGAHNEQDDEGDNRVEIYVREGRKVGRNEPCPCGSGKKFKHCHGKIAS